MVERVGILTGTETLLVFSVLVIDVPEAEVLKHTLHTTLVRRRRVWLVPLLLFLTVV